jgi:hypothetical protein
VEVTDGKHIVQLPDDLHVLRLHANLFCGFPQGGRLQTIVVVVTGAARERYLALMVLDLMGAFSEHYMSLAISVIDQNENSGRGRVAALQAPWYIVR